MEPGALHILNSYFPYHGATAQPSPNLYNPLRLRSLITPFFQREGEVFLASTWVASSAMLSTFCWFYKRINRKGPRRERAGKYCGRHLSERMRGEGVFELPSPQVLCTVGTQQRRSPLSQAFEDTSVSEAYSIADNKGKQEGGGPRSFTLRGRE